MSRGCASLRRRLLLGGCEDCAVAGVGGGGWVGFAGAGEGMGREGGLG
jgi:hypothetical protein